MFYSDSWITWTHIGHPPQTWSSLNKTNACNFLLSVYSFSNTKLHLIIHWATVLWCTESIMYCCISNLKVLYQGKIVDSLLLIILSILFWRVINQKPTTKLRDFFRFALKANVDYYLYHCSYTMQQHHGCRPVETLTLKNSLVEPESNVP